MIMLFEMLLVIFAFTSPILIVLLVCFSIQWQDNRKVAGKMPNVK